MKVILQEKVRHLGELGAIVNVKPGFARNYLIPTGKAMQANQTNLAEFEKRRAELEQAMAIKQKDALVRQEALEKLGVVVVTAKSAEGGKLFGSIGTRDLANAVTAAGVALEKSEVSLPEGALRMLGDYEISVDLGGGTISIVKVSVVAEAVV